jgi:soluble P-type ATPase
LPTIRDYVLASVGDDSNVQKTVDELVTREAGVNIAEADDSEGGRLMAGARIADCEFDRLRAGAEPILSLPIRVMYRM